MTAVATDRDEFVAAVRAQAFRRVSDEHPDGDPELLAQYPGGVVHSLLGGMGADWSADAVVELIEEADDVEWAGHLLDHELRVAAVQSDRHVVYRFDVKQPDGTSAREGDGIDWRGVVDRASAVAVGAGAPADATLPEQVEWLAHELHGPTLHPTAEPTIDVAVVKDSETLLTDEARALFGISARPLRQVVNLVEALDEATKGEPIRAPLGDIAADFVGTLEVIEGESDGSEVDPQGSKLIGWIARTENWWEFVPCLPHRWWSTERAGWVDHETIYAENTRRRREED